MQPTAAWSRVLRMHWKRPGISGWMLTGLVGGSKGWRECWDGWKEGWKEGGREGSKEARKEGGKEEEEWREPLREGAQDLTYYMYDCVPLQLQSKTLAPVHKDVLPLGAN